MAIRSLYDDYNTRFPDNENPVSNRTSFNSESETARPVKRGCLSSDASKRWLQDYQQFIESTKSTSEVGARFVFGRTCLALDPGF